MASPFQRAKSDAQELSGPAIRSRRRHNDSGAAAGGWSEMLTGRHRNSPHLRPSQRHHRGRGRRRGGAPPSLYRPPACDRDRIGPPAPLSRSATRSSAAASEPRPGSSAWPSTVVVVSRDSTHCLRRMLPVVAVRFFGDVDDAAGVGEEVGNVQSAHRRKRVGHFGSRQLIVCSAHNDLVAEIGHEILRQDPAQPTRGEDVSGCPESIERIHNAGLAPARTASSARSWLRSEAMTTARRSTRSRMTCPPTLPWRLRRRTDGGPD